MASVMAIGERRLVERVFHKGPDLGPLNRWIELGARLAAASDSGLLPFGVGLVLACRGDAAERGTGRRSSR